MPRIRLIAAAAAAVVLALSLQPALAQSSDDANPSRVTAAQPASAPMKLDNFMTTWKPVSVSRRAKKSRSKSARKSSQPAARQVAAKPAAADTASRQAAGAPAQNSEKTVETDGVAVTSFNDVNELDAAANTVAANQVPADQVQVVAFNEVNEIDLAAPPAPASATVAPPPPSVYAETTGQAVASEQPAPSDNSWIGKLLLAAGGTIALAGAARFFLVS